MTLLQKKLANLSTNLLYKFCGLLKRELYGVQVIYNTAHLLSLYKLCNK